MQTTHLPTAELPIQPYAFNVQMCGASHGKAQCNVQRKAGLVSKHMHPHPENTPHLPFNMHANSFQTMSSAVAM